MLEEIIVYTPRTHTNLVLYMYNYMEFNCILCI